MEKCSLEKFLMRSLEIRLFGNERIFGSSLLVEICHSGSMSKTKEFFWFFDVSLHWENPKSGVQISTKRFPESPERSERWDRMLVHKTTWVGVGVRIVIARGCFLKHSFTLWLASTFHIESSHEKVNEVFTKSMKEETIFLYEVHWT